MDHKLLKSLMAVAAALVMTACSEAPKTPAVDTKAAEAKKEPEKPPEPVAAKTAFWEMYKPARAWANDVLPLTMASNEVPGFTPVDGKYPMWTGVFVSPSRREAITFFYAIADYKDDAHKGVTSSSAQVWSGATPKSKPFATADFATNSDDAYKTAFAKAGPWVAKHPGKKLVMYLANTNRFPGPAWYLLWGDTKSGYAAFVDASTGAALK
jgi:hypothetical protein